MKQLKDFKVNERIPRPAIEFFPGNLVMTKRLGVLFFIMQDV